MVADEVQTVHGHIGIASDLKPQDAWLLLSQLYTLCSEYMPLAGKLQGLGSPVSRDESLQVMKRIVAARSKASSLALVPSSGVSGAVPWSDQASLRYRLNYLKSTCRFLVVAPTPRLAGLAPLVRRWTAAETSHWTPNFSIS